MRGCSWAGGRRASPLVCSACDGRNRCESANCKCNYHPGLGRVPTMSHGYWKGPVTLLLMLVALRGAVMAVSFPQVASGENDVVTGFVIVVDCSRTMATASHWNYAQW